MERRYKNIEDLETGKCIEFVKKELATMTYEELKIDYKHEREVYMHLGFTFIERKRSKVLELFRKEIDKKTLYKIKRYAK